MFSNYGVEKTTYRLDKKKEVIKTSFLIFKTALIGSFTAFTASFFGVLRTFLEFSTLVFILLLLLVLIVLAFLRHNESFLFKGFTHA